MRYIAACTGDKPYNTLYLPKPKQLNLLMRLPFRLKMNDKQKPHTY